MSKIAFMFPGQGAQKAGMGKDFYEQSETARKVIDKAAELLDIDMKALCFEENDKLDQTEYTQAALVTVCLAMEHVLRERGLNPDVTAGLSLGEYCAIASAGGMTTEDAITTVRKRGILMQNAVPGGKGSMAAVLGMTGEAIEKVVDEIDGVITFAELAAIFMALDIDVNKMPDADMGNVDSFKDCREYAISGGVAGCVLNRIDNPESVRIMKIDGLDKKTVRLMSTWPKRAPEADLVEVMVCQGGCIAGPGTIVKPQVALRLREQLHKAK